MTIDKMRQEAFRMLEGSLGGKLEPQAKVWWGEVCENDRFELVAHGDGTSDHYHEHAKGDRGREVGVWARYGDVSVCYMRPPNPLCVDCGDPTARRCEGCHQPVCPNCLTDPALGLCDRCYQQGERTPVFKLDESVFKAKPGPSGAYELSVGKGFFEQLYSVAMRAGDIHAWERDRARHIEKLHAKRLYLALNYMRDCLDISQAFIRGGEA
jgi:hypothetical protein